MAEAATTTAPAIHQETPVLHQRQTATTEVTEKGERISDTSSLDKKDAGALASESGHKVRRDVEAAHDAEVAEESKEHRHEFYARYRPFILGALALLILAWWISSLVLEATRHRWIVQSIFAWFFIL